jgi:hypothetical protein
MSVTFISLGQVLFIVLKVVLLLNELDCSLGQFLSILVSAFDQIVLLAQDCGGTRTEMEDVVGCRWCSV